MSAHAASLDTIDGQLAPMRETLVRLAHINSGSHNAAGVRKVAQEMERLFAPLGAQAQWMDLPPLSVRDLDGQTRTQAVGPALRLRQRPQAPLQIFLGGHLDTVFAADSAFQTTTRVSEDVLRGPGVADLKGGLVVMWQALRVLEQSPLRERIGWTVLLNPDEEIGSPASLPLLQEAARQHHLGLIYEPALPGGHLSGQRKGSGNFELVVHGRAAHAGRDFAAGRNAIAVCAELVGALYRLNGQRDGVTLNPGLIHGGGALNVVPERALVKFNVRVASDEDRRWVQGRLDVLMEQLRQREGYSGELHGGFTRPPKPVDAPMRRLMDHLQDCGRQLGLELQFHATGGCCDGNNLAAFGLPNLDNLGVVGEQIHSDREWMRISSLTERARLSALLLLRLASGDLTWT
jgi:glutamate carboxypeptidase